MKTYIVLMAAVAFSFTAASAQAGGWSNKGNISSGGLVNVSPSVALGDVKVLNGVLNGNAIASGNTVGNILNGTGLLNGNALGILSGNKSIGKKH
jgi:hypothetical protein